MIKLTVFGDLSVTPEDVELYDYRWNGVSIKAQTSSRVIKRDS